MQLQAFLQESQLILNSGQVFSFFSDLLFCFSPIIRFLRIHSFSLSYGGELWALGGLASYHREGDGGGLLIDILVPMLGLGKVNRSCLESSFHLYWIRQQGK